VSDELEQLRRDAAAARGLDPAAAAFLGGTTLEGIERSADELANFLGARRGGEQEREPETDPLRVLLAGGATAKSRSQQALLASLHGRPVQPDDAARREPARGFDGGARERLPVGREPITEHGALVAELASLARTFRR
jgi:hypothetical protein